MKFQINNQSVDIAGGVTRIRVTYNLGAPVPHQDFKYNFDLRRFPTIKQELKAKDYPSYWWLGTLYNEISKLRGQLKLEL